MSESHLFIFLLFRDMPHRSRESNFLTVREFSINCKIRNFVSKQDAYVTGIRFRHDFSPLPLSSLFSLLSIGSKMFASFQLAQERLRLKFLRIYRTMCVGSVKMSLRRISHFVERAEREKRYRLLFWENIFLCLALPRLVLNA